MPHTKANRGSPGTRWAQEPRGRAGTREGRRRRDISRNQNTGAGAGGAGAGRAGAGGGLICGRSCQGSSRSAAGAARPFCTTSGRSGRPSMRSSSPAPYSRPADLHVLRAPVSSRMEHRHHRHTAQTALTTTRIDTNSGKCGPFLGPPRQDHLLGDERGRPAAAAWDLRRSEAMGHGATAGSCHCLRLDAVYPRSSSCGGP